MSYEFDPLAPKEVIEPIEMVSLDAIVASATADRVKFKTTMDMAQAISVLAPDSEQTLIGVALDQIGYKIEPANEDDGVTEDTITFDEDALAYTLGVTMDFISALGVSDTAREDLTSMDSVIACDELANVASLLNDTTTDSIDLPTLVTMSMDSVTLAGHLGLDEDVTLDAIVGAELEDVTLDWAFSRSGKPARRGSGHNMKIVDCVRRGEDGQVHKGKCRYPKSLLKGKYKKSKNTSKAQKMALARLAGKSRNGKWRSRISEAMVERIEEGMQSHKANSKNAKKA